MGNYPYDLQVINMTFGSWIYADYRILISFRPTPLYIYDTFKLEHIEWDIVGNKTELLQYKFSTGSY